MRNFFAVALLVTGFNGLLAVKSYSNVTDSQTKHDIHMDPDWREQLEKSVKNGEC